MNREEWLSYIEEDEKYPKRAIILDIFDDFESRVCENCEYSRLSTERYLAYDIECDLNVSHVDYGFGCNEFKRKEE